MGFLDRWRGKREGRDVSEPLPAPVVEPSVVEKEDPDAVGSLGKYFVEAPSVAHDEGAGQADRDSCVELENQEPDIIDREFVERQIVKGLSVTERKPDSRRSRREQRLSSGNTRAIRKAREKLERRNRRKRGGD